MEILKLIEFLAEQAGVRHLTLMTSFGAAMNGAMTTPGAFSALSTRALKADIMNAAWTYIDGQRDILRHAVESVASEARQSALSDLGLLTTREDEMTPSDALTRSQSASEDYAMGEIVAQTERDVAQTLKTYSRLGIRAEMIRVARGVDQETAVTEVAIGQITERMKLWFTDRAGRRIPSQKHIRRLWRQVLRDHYVTVYLLVAAEHGQATVRIWHPDPNHRSFGDQIHLDGEGPRLEDYEDVFHPNANALPLTEAAFKELTT